MVVQGLAGQLVHVLEQRLLDVPEEPGRGQVGRPVAALSEDERRPVFSEVAAVLDSDESVSGGGRLRLPFVVSAYRATRA